jgi:penicillin amidase
MRAVKFLFKCVWKLFKWSVVLLVLLVAAAAGFLTFKAFTALPDHDATVRSARLSGEVRVVRDNWGVPHILANSEADAYFALGYCMAQDRLFQMETLRRLARGELAELLGPPAVVVDRIMRAFRLRAKAEEFVDMADSMPPAMTASMNAFVAGVNQFIDDGPLPFEFSALQIPKPTFTLVDCLSVAAVLPITFADGLRGDPLVTMLKQRHPDLDIDRLFPGYRHEAATVMETLEEAAEFLRGNPGEPGGGEAAADAVNNLHGWFEGLLLFAENVSPRLGSNSWVLAPSKTKSGHAILANDPHIGFTNPSIWYEAHLKFGDFENYGYHFPPIPIPLLGHNEDRGWGMTMFANDDVDMYMERFNPANPDQVMYRGEWVDVEVVEEVIKVRFGRDVVERVRITPHGPILTDLLELLQGYEGPPIALRWVWQNVEYTDVEALYRMTHARDLESFGEAVSMITSPGLNISYADTRGNIAWWAAGLLPIRPAHINHKELLDGWSGEDEIEMYLPREANPHLVNPPWGYIVTANNMSTVKPLGEPPLQLPQLQGYWQPGDRAARIEELLDARDDWTIEDLKAVQMDDFAWAAPRIVPVLAEEARKREELLSPRQKQALAELEAWDFHHAVDSVGATVYEYWTDCVQLRMLDDVMDEQALRAYASLADHWNAFKEIILDPAAPFWDDTRTDAVETRTDIVLLALKDAAARMAADLGDDPAGWTWGRAHTMTFKHPFGYLPLLGRLLNIGPFPSPGSAQTVNNMLWGGFGNFDVIAGPSTRRLIDFAEPERSLTILPTGNSGHVMSPHYDDQAAMFVRGDYRPAHYTWSDIEAHKTHEMRFLPR